MTPTSASSTGLRDSSSPAYKKARKKYLKTLRNRNDQDNEWTPFRAAEKKFKSRFPPPDLSNVLDLATLDKSRVDETQRGGWCGKPDVLNYREMLLIDQYEGQTPRKCYIFPGTPGLVLLPAFVPPEEQRQLVRWALCDQAKHPNETNLDTHYNIPALGIWNKFLQERPTNDEEDIQPRASSSTNAVCPDIPGPRRLIANEPADKINIVELNSIPKTPPVPSSSVQPAPASILLRKLRWANIGWSYHWGSKQYDFTKGKGKISDEIRSVCKNAVRSINWSEVFGLTSHESDDWGDDGPDWARWNDTYEPDAGIVNFYQTKDTLMAHVDRSEVCATSPLVSISLGCAAIFLIGGHTRDAEPIPILLRSGDVIMMSGPACRRAYHGVPRILEDTLPLHLTSDVEDPDWKPYSEYLRTTRVNINVRQVFPRGFDPAIVNASLNS